MVIGILASRDRLSGIFSIPAVDGVHKYRLLLGLRLQLPLIFGVLIRISSHFFCSLSVSSALITLLIALITRAGSEYSQGGCLAIIGLS